MQLTTSLKLSKAIAKRRVPKEVNRHKHKWETGMGFTPLSPIPCFSCGSYISFCIKCGKVGFFNRDGKLLK